MAKGEELGVRPRRRRPARLNSRFQGNARFEAGLHESVLRTPLTEVMRPNRFIVAEPLFDCRFDSECRVTFGDPRGAARSSRIVSAMNWRMCPSRMSHFGGSLHPIVLDGLRWGSSAGLMPRMVWVRAFPWQCRDGPPADFEAIWSCIRSAVRVGMIHAGPPGRRIGWVLGSTGFTRG